MTTTIPKPVFVIADVHSGSYTTAMEVTTAGQISASISNTKDDNDDDEPVLLCGTNDGSLSLWSLRTYRCLHRFSPEELATLLELSQPIQPGDPVRITSLHAHAGRLLLQLKSNELFLLDFRSSLRHPVSLLSERPWSTFSTTFAQFFPLFEHCYAFLAEEPLNRSGASKADVIQLVNSRRCLPFCRVKLVSKAEKDEEEKGHGIVMALHLFTKDIASSSGAEDDEPKQALYLLLAYEDGFIELYRATFKEHLQTLFEKASATRQKSLSAQQQPVFEAVQTSGLQSHAEMVTCIAFHEGTSRGVACSVDNEIAIWEVRTAEDSSWRRRRLGEGEEGGDEKKDKQLGLVERRSRRIRLTNAGILCAAIRPDGRIFATGGKDGRLRLFGLRTGKPLAVLAYHANTIEAVRFGGGSLSSSNHNSEGSLLFAASRDKSISVWSLYTDD
ncbi:Guanine nucleotide binding protein (G protein), beta polypeptide 1-like [Tyrophagus putrescentiae]|nr:Guanine nucleotide binding protein (G protein), beta polypeptide 1-like [Tyrophagus putrescentiae]